MQEAWQQMLQSNTPNVLELGQQTRTARAAAAALDARSYMLSLMHAAALLRHRQAW